MTTRLIFHVADTLTGRVVGRLHPTRWELSDPWTGVGTGRITVPLPGPDLVPALVEATRARRRWVAVQDDQGRFLWGGPITARPGRDEGTVTIPVADWRSWFYRAPLRPTDAGDRDDYVVRDRDQADIFADLVKRALDTPGAPAMAVDLPEATGVTRDRTLMMLDRSVGDHLDGLSAREVRDGIEWWVYVLADPQDPTRLVPHVCMAHPERQTRPTPVRLQWVRGSGGNLADVSWPEGEDEPTRVWALGEGQPPDQAWAVDEDLDVDDGLEVAWEQTIGPLDGVSRSEGCFEAASAALEFYAGRSGQVTATVIDGAIPIGDYGTGDRARLVYDDGWDRVDLEAVRITGRTLSGGAGQALQARLTLDLANDGYGDTGAVPGEQGV